MSQEFPEIDKGMADWIGRQAMFFVSTAPLAADGYVNCSPKGLDTFRILEPNRVAWLDLTGSGAETAAHLRENGRIVVMFCAFDGPPRIVRLHGRGRVYALGSSEFESMQMLFPTLPGARAIIDIEVTRISDSCGYAVPRMQLQGDRDVLERWSNKRGEEGLKAYRAQYNRHSLDGLPAFDGPTTDMFDGASD